MEKFYCKINEVNEGSIALFQKLGFVEVNYAKPFQEYEYAFIVEESDMTRSKVLSWTRHVSECTLFPK